MPRKIATIFPYFFISASIFLLSWFFNFPAEAYVRSSTNYRLESDSLNLGGNRSTSASYHGEDTIGEMATGNSSSTNYALKAGYQQMHEVSIALSAVSDIAMSPNIMGVTGGTANGSGTWTVTTDDAAGYTLMARASTDPAMQCLSGGCQAGADSFANYTPALSGTPDYTWSIANTVAEFGVTVEGNDTISKFKDNGSACNTGSSNAVDHCWDYLTNADSAVAASTAANQSSGTATTLKFRAQSGGNHVQPSGAYQATIVVTAIAN